MTEFWKPIFGCESYSVSTLGNVRNNKTGNLVAVQNNPNPCVVIRKNGTSKFYKVDYLVASAFIANPHMYEKIYHLNGDKFDCQATNLYWGYKGMPKKAIPNKIELNIVNCNEPSPIMIETETIIESRPVIVPSPVIETVETSVKQKKQNNFVCWCDMVKMWQSVITINNKHKHLGFFDTEEEAIAMIRSFLTEKGLLEFYEL